MGVLIDIAADSATTAQELLALFQAELAATQAARDAMVASQEAAVADIDNKLGLLAARISDLQAFVDFQNAQAG